MSATSWIVVGRAWRVSGSTAPGAAVAGVVVGSSSRRGRAHGGFRTRALPPQCCCGRWGVGCAALVVGLGTV